MAEPTALRPKPRILPPVLCIRRPRILVVEDDHDLLPVVERIARSLDRDLVVDGAPDVPTAQRLLGERDYALVLSDYLLDERGSGLALRDWCRQNGVGVPFAMMSAFPLRDELDRSGGPPCPFLPKPFSVRSLRAFLQGLLDPPLVTG